MRTGICFNQSILNLERQRTMTCRVGITTDLIARRAYWEKQFPKTFRNWQVVETCYSKSQAQTQETLLADAWGCESHPGGDGPEISTWHVYYFQHDGY